MRFARFPISDGMLPVRVFMPRLSTLRPRNEQSSGGILPWNLLLYRARISRPVQLASDAGICPWKALSLRLRWLSSARPPSSGGRTPCSRLPARWSRLRYVRLPRSGGTVPRRPSPGSSSATTRPRRRPLAPHATPHHRHTGTDQFPHVGGGGEPLPVDMRAMNAVSARPSSTSTAAAAAAAASHASGHTAASKRRLPASAIGITVTKMSQLYRKAKQWLSGLLSDSGITTGAYPVDAY
uniref:Uncharacterized protein n=1 Tax=Oryza meridionalis TaxID=40149 RepID=A0A0E0CHX5_9ORYZ